MTIKVNKPPESNTALPPVKNKTVSVVLPLQEQLKTASKVFESYASIEDPVQRKIKEDQWVKAFCREQGE